MHYRAQMMAGSLRIERASAGTVVRCWFPRHLPRPDGHVGKPAEAAA
jgi:hypothetical protein